MGFQDLMHPVTQIASTLVMLCITVILYLLYAPLAIPLVYCHINDFQRASRLARPFQGGAKMTAVWASHHEELCSAGVVAPRVHIHMVAPHRCGALDGGNPLGSDVAR